MSALHFISRFICRFVPVILGLLSSPAMKAQNFDYSAAKDSVGWQELNTQTILNPNDTDWRFAYKIPIGFTFNYLGQNFDSVTIEKSGLIVLDENRTFCFWGLIGCTQTTDSLQHISVLGYHLSGTQGSRILTIQFKNVAYGDRPSGLISYQVCLHEDRSISMTMGYYDRSGSWSPDPEQPIAVGLVNQNMDTETRGFMLSGSPGSPGTIVINDDHPSVGIIKGLPTCGTRYTFTPNF